MQYLAALLLTLALPLATAAEPDTPHAYKTLEIFTTIVEMETAKGLGNVPGMANYLRGELLDAGFPEEDLEVVPLGETAVFIARYRGDGSSGEAPILLLGHMDVVDANPDDWERPPFTLTRDQNFYYARGTIDNKMGIAHLVSTFIRLKQEGFVPDRALIITLTGDEETGMETTRALVTTHRDLTDAEYVLNADGGGGYQDRDGNALAYLLQAAEKTYASFDITVRNPGGHSSLPREDNAIYELAAVLKNIEAFEFPADLQSLV